MSEQRPEDHEPPEPKPERAPQRPKDIAREDADSPTAIPLFPPQGDGS